MKMNELRPAKGSRKKRFKVGRGPGSGLGKTSGRGGKGQTARKSGPVGAAFEGGQNPFTGDLEKHFQAGTTVTVKELNVAGLIRQVDKPVKVLGAGKLSKSLTVKANQFSATAKAAIEAAGGKAEVG